MKSVTLIFLLGFFIVPVYGAVESSSSDKFCAYATQGVHTIPDYRRILAALSDDESSERKRSKKRRTKGKKGTGKR